MKPASVPADDAVDCEAGPLNSNGRAGDRVIAAMSHLSHSRRSGDVRVESGYPLRAAQ
jgi:hypothetical protein